MTSSTRLLTIGEFAAATQLSLKALRLYDDARILPPAEVDSNNGYRYYRRDQVPTARLVRTLREMDVPLAEIARIVAAPAAQMAALLTRSAQEIDRRYARQKRAFQMGLSSLKNFSDGVAPKIQSRPRGGMTVTVVPATATRATLLQRLRMVCAELRSQDESIGPAFCILTEPLSDDESRLEIAFPSAAARRDSTQRQMPETDCAVHEMPLVDADGPRIEAALDAMFDWLDRNGYRASESPVIAMRDRESLVELSWAYAPTIDSRGNA